MVRLSAKETTAACGLQSTITYLSEAPIRRIDLQVYSNTRPLGRVPSPQVVSGIGIELSLYVLCWGLMVLQNTAMLSLLLWDRSEWSAQRLRSEREADRERRSAGMCKTCLLSFSLVNPKGKCWI